MEGASDPALLAAELEDAVSEFNRLANLASAAGIFVFAELRSQEMVDQPPRPILAVQIVTPPGGANEA